MKILRRQKPLTAKAVPWNKIQEAYEGWVSVGLPLGSMLSLVKYIRESGLSERLYAYTSMHKLVVTIYDFPEWHREELHIEHDFDVNKWLFEYYPKPYRPIEHQRIYIGDIDPIARFLRYIELLKW